MSSSHPYYIQFYPTLRCTMSCSFCFNAGLKEIGDMPAEDFRKMARILAHSGIREIDFLGGEPTLHSGIEEMADIALSLGLKTSVSSNGSRIPVAKRLIDAFGDACVLGISLNDGRSNSELDEFLSDSRPLVKSLYRKIGGLEQRIKSVLEKTHGKFYLIYPDIISGNREDSLPFHEFYDAISTTQRTMPAVEPVFCSGFLPESMRYPELSMTRCSAGVTKLGIMPDGSVFPCNLFFGMGEFYIGNIFTDGFADIWNSPKLSFFRRFEENRCSLKDCNLHAKCHGGCPAHSMKFYGTLDGPDPRCGGTLTMRQNLVRLK
ncbi:MAG TPA: radical SAM/SPASM domain-containing protein [Thermodesulfovibrionales bacterium]|nr:radical SAM/SPASM domain-containing protein [Thermodesulfovibrionales bacterium]